METEKKRLSIKAAVILALLAGVLVTAIALAGAWVSHKRKIANIERIRSESIIGHVVDAIEDYEAQYGILPENLEILDLCNIKFASYNATGKILDAWHHPLVYTQIEDGFEIQSSNKDGEIVCTKQNDEIKWINTHEFFGISFRHFITDSIFSDMRYVCVGTGALASVCCLILSIQKKDNLRKVFFPVLITIAVSIVFAVVLAGIHIPTGH